MRITVNVLIYGQQKQITFNSSVQNNPDAIAQAIDAELEQQFPEAFQAGDIEFVSFFTTSSY